MKEEMQRDDADAEEIREKAGDLQKRSLSLFEIAYKKVCFELRIQLQGSYYKWQVHDDVIMT